MRHARILAFSAVLTVIVTGAMATMFTIAESFPDGDDESRSALFLVIPVAIVFSVPSSAALVSVLVAPRILGYRSWAGVIATVVAGVMTAQIVLLTGLLAPKLFPPKTDSLSLVIFGLILFILSILAIYFEDSRRKIRLLEKSI